MNIDFKKTKYVSNEGYLTLRHLEKNNILNNYYLIKRIRKKNSQIKKYISGSVFTNNLKFKKS